MKKFFAFFMGMVFILGGSFVWADATIVTTFKSDGFRGMGAMASTQTRQYQGEKMSEKSSSQFTGAVLSFLTSATENVTITRVDKGVYWALETKNKSYTETPIQPLKISKQTPREGKEEKPKARVSKSEITVKKTGASETIHGFPCQEYLITWLMEIENLETREKAQNIMETRLWTTPVTSTIQKAQADEQRFSRALMKKIGDISPEDAKMMGAAMMGSMMSESDMKKGMVKVKKEMAKIKGYPIRTVVSWSMEGANSGASTSRKPDSEERSAPASGSFGSILTGMMGSLGMNKGEQKADEKSPGSVMFGSTMEVKSIEADPLPGSSFEIPGGYTRKGE